MKKTGIVNRELMSALTGLAHHDLFAIIDVGMPVPKAAKVIDLSIVPGMPDFMAVFKAILAEFAFERYVIIDAMKTRNREIYDHVTRVLNRQERIECSMEAWMEKSKQASFFVRTGEIRPCSNILLESTAVQEMFLKLYDVSCDIG